MINCNAKCLFMLFYQSLRSLNNCCLTLGTLHAGLVKVAAVRYKHVLLTARTTHIVLVWR